MHGLPGHASRLAGNLDGNLACLGELDRIAHQIEQYLAQPDLIADDELRHIGIYQLPQLQVLFSGAQGKGLDGSIDHLAQIAGHPLDMEHARLDLREIQDIVDDGDQRLGR